MTSTRKAMLVTIGIISSVMLMIASLSFAHDYDVTLVDANNSTVTNGFPYSPKATCGTTNCHDPIKTRYGIEGTVYESNPAESIKIQSGASYAVPYPMHGVTAGYHFQQGRNVSWGSVQKTFYGQPGFTSSPGMYGKY